MEKDEREAGTYGKGRQRPGSSVSPLLALLLLLLASSWALVARRHNARLCYNSVTQILENSFSSTCFRKSVYNVSKRRKTAG